MGPGQMPPEMAQGAPAGGQPAPGQGAPPGGQPGPGGPAGGGQEQQMMEMISQMTDQIVSITGPEGFGELLQSVLEQLMSAEQGGGQPQGQPPPQEPQVPSSKPVPGGEGFGPAFE